MRILNLAFITTLFTLITLSCDNSEIREMESDLEVNAVSRTSLTNQLESAISTLIEHVENQNTLHEGIIYDEIENGASLKDLVNSGYLNEEFVATALADIDLLNQQIVNQHSQEYLTGWYDENSDNFPTSSKFCFICREVVTTPPVHLPNGDCFETDIIRWKFLGITIWEGTGDTHPC